MTEDDSDGEWLTIAEAAKRLGVKPGAIHSRIQRKTLRVRPGKQANDGLVRVWITPTTGPVIGATSGPTSGPTSASISELLAEIAVLHERIGRHEGTEAELRARLADRDRDRDRLVQELAAERQHGRELAGRLDQLHERYRADIDALRAELATERHQPWWRRLRR